MYLSLLVLILQISNEVLCVPATPTDTLLEDVKSMKEGLHTLANLFEKWNLVYATQVEPRTVSAMTMLTSIESNVKNLQDRAHVWDTFQLHVSAWNEQMSTADRKLDIISKAQEKLLILDGKVNAIENIDYKLETLSKKLEATQENIAEISKRLDETPINRDSLFGEFATRGILSTLKQIERKLDKVQLNYQGAAKQIKDNGEETTRGKFTIKCNTPPIVEELLTDVSSKVDIIFDKINAKYEDEFEESDDYLEEPEGNGTIKVVREARQDEDAKLVRKLLKRINQPCKDFNGSLFELKETLKSIGNNTLVVLENQGAYFNKYTHQCSNQKNNSHEVLLKLEHILHYMNYTDTTQGMAIHNHFVEQQKHFETTLDKLKAQTCENSRFQSTTTESTRVYTSTETEEPNYSYHTDVLECSDVNEANSSGIYLLGSVRDYNVYNFDYFTRFCELRDGQHWTVVQRRGAYSVNPLDFSQNWERYKYGFGDLQKEFWFGNEYIHRLTQENDVALRVELKDFSGNLAWAEYETFKVATEQDNYKITIGGYRGNASDSLSSHNQSMFSTFDRKNDEAPDCCPCAASYGGGWWFNSCFEANLNGIYHKNPTSNDYFRGIIWEHWLGDYSLKKTKMMIRAKLKTNTEGYSETTEQFTTNLPPYLEDP